MRKILFGIFFTLFIVFIIATIVFGFLFFRTQATLNDREVSLARANDRILSLEAEQSTDLPTENTETGLLIFEDVGADILIRYPSSWDLVVDTDMSEEFAYEPVYGRILQDYDIVLSKDTVSLEFNRILGAVDGFGSGIKASEYEIVEVSDSIVRYSELGTNIWSYVETIDCDEIEMFLDESPESYDLCVGSFFPGFANIGAADVTIITSDELVLSEADAIVLSTQ